MYRHMLCFILGLFLSACVPQTSPAPSGVSSPQKIRREWGLEQYSGNICLPG